MESKKSKRTWDIKITSTPKKEAENYMKDLIQKYKQKYGSTAHTHDKLILSK